MSKFRLLGSATGPSSAAIQSKLNKARRAEADALETYKGEAFTALNAEAPLPSEKRLSEARATVARLEAALELAEAQEAKEAAAKAAEARRKRNEGTLAAFDDLVAKAEALAPLAARWTAGYAALVKASNAVVVAATNNPEVRRDLIFSVGNVYDAASDELTRLHGEG
ncbi:MAG TPA: hypothetical protein VG735_08300, partial [Caulobacterales bacterium]|nr:hypothetical protein [Caulobacterales bacterium]